MTSIGVDAQAKRELSAGELELVAGGGLWKLGPPGWNPEPRLGGVENRPQLGGGGLLKNPHLRLF